MLLPLVRLEVRDADSTVSKAFRIPEDWHHDKSVDVVLGVEKVRKCDKVPIRFIRVGRKLALGIG